MIDWKNRELDAAYLLDSGLLFEINRNILHQMGIAIIVKKDQNGKAIFGFKDFRNSPEELLFSKEVYEKGTDKLRKFVRDFGYRQMKKRENVLGWSSQSSHIPENGRYKREIA